MSPTKADTPGIRIDRGAGPRLDPRIHQRRAAVARRAGRRRLRLLLGAVLVVMVLAAAWSLLHSGLLSARVVTVSGAVNTPPSEIVSVSGLARHPPLIDVDPGAVATRLERLPWIAAATVSRRWPDGIAISVVERRPVAVVPSTAAAAPAAAPTAPPATAAATAPAATAAPTAPPATATPTAPPATAAAAGGWALVDRTGRILADVSSPPGGLVRLDVPAAGGAPGSQLGVRAVPGLEVAASLPRAFAGQVTQVEVTAGGQVTLDLTTPVTVQLGNTTQLAQKYEDVAAILAGAKLIDGDVIDVSVPGSPAVAAG